MFGRPVRVLAPVMRDGPGVLPRPLSTMPRMGPVHPLATVLEDAERGRFPKPDGGWSRSPMWRSGLEAVTGFTAHGVFCLGDDITDDRLRELGANGYGGAHDPRLITAIAEPGSHIGCIDLLFVARGRGGGGRGALVPRHDLLDHPRVRHAANFRDDLDVYGLDDPTRSAVVVLGRGVAGLHELSTDLEPDRCGRGEGRALAEAALALPSYIPWTTSNRGLPRFAGASVARRRGVGLSGGGCQPCPSKAVPGLARPERPDRRRRPGSRTGLAEG